MSETTQSVLILEDNEDIALLLSQLIVAYGATPVVCASRASAEEALTAPDICLALLDIMLPGIDGREVAALVREKRPQLPIYYMTGMPEREIGEEALALANGMLRKPFSISDLRAMLSQHLQPRPPSEDIDVRRGILEIMATLASEHESILRQHDRLQSAVGEFEAAGDARAQEINRCVQGYSSTVEESLAHFKKQLENIQRLIDKE